MKKLLLALLCIPVIAFAQNPVEKYPVDSASVEHPGVPKGEVLKFTFANSKIYPGTWREYWVYIPVEYDPAKPACVFVDQDAVQFKSPTVFDNLIYSHEMPVTIGVYISPGRVLAKDTTALDRYNRSFEFDALGDAYARFVLDELLPDVEKHKASNGRPIVLSHKGNDRMIAGTSSGGICAFTAAWERPDAFSRVFTGIGTYVSLRGGDRYSSLVRKYEPKPIKVFLQDGSHDQNAYGGDWFYANQMMERSLTFAGYEVNHAWGEGAHTSNQATAIFPDAMRWLWKGYPTPIAAGKSKNPFLTAILIDDEDWDLVGNGLGALTDLAVQKGGDIGFETRLTRNKYVISGDGKLTLLGKLQIGVLNTRAAYGYFGSDGGLTNNPANDLVSLHSTDQIYFTGADGTANAGKLLTGRKLSFPKVIDQGLSHPYGLALTPDHSQLYVTEEGSHWIWLFNINADGSLTNKQRYGWLHAPDTTDSAQPRGIQVDRDGRVYVATALGIQILDQAGRVNAILPLPVGAGPATALCFGGKNFDELYVTCGGKIYRRKLNTKGMNDFDAAVKPAKPRL